MNMEINTTPDGRRESLAAQFRMAIMSAKKTRLTEHHTDGSRSDFYFGQATVSPDIAARFYLPESQEADERLWSDAYVSFVLYNRAPAMSVYFKSNNQGEIERKLMQDRGEFKKPAFVTRNLDIIEIERLIAAMRMPSLMVENIREFLRPTDEESAMLASQK